MARQTTPDTAFLSVSAAPIATTPLTMSIWFNADSDNGSNNNMMTISDTGSNSIRASIILRAGAGGNPCAADVNGSRSGNTANTTFGVWNHLAGVFGSTTSRFAWLNGVQSTEGTTSQTLSSIDTLSIGIWRRSSGDLLGFNGRLAEAGLWNVALSDAEIGALSRHVLPWRIRPASLVGYWPLNGLETTEPDYSTNHNPLADTGSTTKGNHAPVPPLSGRFWGEFPFIEAAVATAIRRPIMRGIVPFPR